MDVLNRENINEHNKVNGGNNVKGLINIYDTSTEDTIIYSVEDKAKTRTKYLIRLLIDCNKDKADKYNITRHKNIRVNNRVLIIYRNNTEEDITNHDIITTANNKYCMFYDDMEKLDYNNVLNTMYKKYGLDVYINN
jgi:hypothetical protein